MMNEYDFTIFFADETLQDIWRHFNGYGKILPVASEAKVSLVHINSLIARFMGQHWAHLGPTGLRWAPCWSHELCYLGCSWGCQVVRDPPNTEHNGNPFIDDILIAFHPRKIFVFSCIGSRDHLTLSCNKLLPESILNNWWRKRIELSGIWYLKECL